MRRKYRLLLWLAGLFVFGPAALHAQVVQGKVVDSLGTPMRGLELGTIPEAERLAVRGW